MSYVKYFFASLLVFMGCSNRNDVPDDFEFIATYEAVQPGALGGYSVSIRKQEGSDNFLIMVRRDTTTRQLIKTRSELNELYREILDKRVFRMNDRYADMNVLDGENTTLVIRANGRKKEIQMRNIVP